MLKFLAFQLLITIILTCEPDEVFLDGNCFT